MAADVRPVGIVGAGTMGAGIAQVAAAAGHPVLLFDAQPGLAAKALERMAASLEKLVSKGRMQADERAALLGRIQACAELSALAPAGVVVEAIIEDLPAKRALFRELEAIVAPEALLTTNTSSLSVAEIADGLWRPARFAGLHFFNPAPVLPLVEVIAGEATAPDVLAELLGLARAWGKSPVSCRSSPGFIVNRGARPFYCETLRFLEDGGADAATIDSLMRATGFRMGPLELIDLVGLDINLAVSRSIYHACQNEPRYRPSRLVEEHAAAGRLGRKSGRGFYSYGSKANPAPTVQAPAAAPTRVEIRGDLGPARALPGVWSELGLEIDQRDGAEGVVFVEGIRLALTDGRTAAERAEVDGEPWVLFDLSLDYAACGQIALAASGEAVPGLAAVIGLFQAGGRKVSLVRDLPGLLVARTLAMLVNEAADIVWRGVASGADVDTAMQKGLNYPGGPLDWGDRLGAGYLLQVIDRLAETYGSERYRVCPLLRRMANTGGKFHE